MFIKINFMSTREFKFEVQQVRSETGIGAE